MAEDFLCPERDELFTYSALTCCSNALYDPVRSRVPLETPQEMFLGIALHLAMNEGSDRMGWVKRFYDMLSHYGGHDMTPQHVQRTESPTISFQAAFVGHCAGQSGRHLPLAGQLLQGHGVGVEWDVPVKCAAGSTIRGFQGRRRAVLSAGSVGQRHRRGGGSKALGMAGRWRFTRRMAPDLPEFLQLRTNNGDDRMKAHDVSRRAIRISSGDWRRERRRAVASHVSA